MSTVLTEGVTEAAPANGAVAAAAAAGQASQPPLNGADAAIKAVQDGPPEYIPAKFWDAEKRSPKVEDLGKGYLNLEKLLYHGDRVPKPASDEDKDGWDRWYKATGRPDDLDGYEFQRPSLPQGLDYDEDTEKNFRAWAHVNGLSKKQASALYDGYVKTQVERHASWQQGQQQARTQAEDAMRREYGQSYDAKIAKARAAMNKYADPDYLKYLNESGRGNDPREIRAWIRVGEEMAGDERLKGSAPAAPSTVDLDRAISTFRTQHGNVLMDKTHPDHTARVEEFTSLFQKRYPEQAMA